VITACGYAVVASTATNMSRYRPSLRGQKRGPEISEVRPVAYARPFEHPILAADSGTIERPAPAVEGIGEAGNLSTGRLAIQESAGERFSTVGHSFHRVPVGRAPADAAPRNPPPDVGLASVHQPRREQPAAAHLTSHASPGAYPPAAGHPAGPAYPNHLLSDHSAGAIQEVEDAPSAHAALAGASLSTIHPAGLACGEDAAREDDGLHNQDGDSDVTDYFGADPYAGAFQLDVGTDDVPDPVPPQAQPCGSLGDMPFADYTEFFCFYYLRGQAGVTQVQYDIMRAFVRDINPTVSPPSLTYIRRVLLPRVRNSWGLPLCSIWERSGSPGAQTGSPLLVVLPSDHIARDFSFAANFALYTAADRRSDAERALHPEFCDSPLFQDLQACTMAGGILRRFALDGEMLCAGDTVSISLKGGAEHLADVTVGGGYFSSSTAGLQLGSAIHAGDFVVPCIIAGVTVGSLVVRHWRQGDNEHLCWVASAGDVASVEQIVRLPRDHEPAVNTCDDVLPRQRRLLSGVGPDGERWYVVSLALYSDDFDGLGGVYMSYLTWLFMHRMSRSGGRVLSLTERGVSSDAVLRAVMSDFTTGAHNGWVVDDPDGVKVRVFADVAFFVGDNEQVSKTSHLRGHNARAPCNLCAYANPRGAIGSVYAQDGTSVHMGLARTTARTVAMVQAAQAADEHGMPL